RCASPGPAAGIHLADGRTAEHRDDGGMPGNHSRKRKNPAASRPIPAETLDRRADRRRVAATLSIRRRALRPDCEQRDAADFANASGLNRAPIDRLALRVLMAVCIARRYD